MSEENNSDNIDKVTTKEKAKSPGRVEWGRKLAKVKQEKRTQHEGKTIRKKLNTVNKNVEEDIKLDKHSVKMLELQNYQIWIGLGAILIAVTALYYQRKDLTPIKIADEKVNRPTVEKKCSELLKDTLLPME
jgi:hypothetical protein